jgi:ariadne-1
MQWYEKEKLDSENLMWIKANTKPCPKCAGNIEKNQGCNHMTCRNCGHNFCWLCLADWSTHGSATGGYYACNLYEKKKETDKDFANGILSQDHAQKEIQRYTYHFERYVNHDKARNIVNK